jgi:ATP-dependent protease ClpP protease subunit
MAILKGHRAALPSASIMIKQPISSFRGQASELEILRTEMRNTKFQTVRNFLLLNSILSIMYFEASNIIAKHR